MAANFWILTRLFVIAIGLVLFALSAHGAVIVVPEDSPTIQSAFELSSRGDTILVSNNTYFETVRVPPGERTLAGNFIYSQNPIDIETTILQPADTVGADTACILLAMEGCSLRVIGVTFSFGKGVRRDNGRFEGGAMYLTGSQLSIEDCRFSECYADFGIGIWANSCQLDVLRTRFHHNGRLTGQSYPQGCIRTTNCDLRVDSSRFDHNTVLGAPGLIALFGSTIVENCQVDSNVNESASLAALSIDGSLLTVRNTTFLRNRQSTNFALVGIHCQAAFATIEYCAFVENYGGAPLSLWSDSVSVLECAFEGNISPERNSAGIILGHGSYLIRGCRFLTNESPNWSCVTSNGRVLIEETLFSGNLAYDDSGAVAMAPADSLIFRDCSFESNQPNAFSTDFWWFEGFMDARECYWGAASGPFQEFLNPNGEGDAILGTDVLFDPWLEHSPLSIEPREHPVVREFSISSAYPNPFNSSVTIEYTLTREQGVRLEIFDVLGRKVATLIEATQSPGVHSVLWQADGQATGLYFARLSAPETRHAAQTVKLLLLK